MAFDAFGAPQFGIDDAKVAAYNATDDYATEVDVPSVQMMGADLETIGGNLEGDNKWTATHAQIVGGQITLRFGSISLAVLEVILGQSIASSGSTPNQVHQIKLSGGDNMPYFGICGKLPAVEGSGDLHAFFPKVKASGGTITLIRAEYGQFEIPEMTLVLVDDATYGAGILIEHETATAVAIPPTNVQ